MPIWGEGRCLRTGLWGTVGASAPGVGKLVHLLPTAGDRTPLLEDNFRGSIGRKRIADR